MSKVLDSIARPCCDSFRWEPLCCDYNTAGIGRNRWCVEVGSSRNRCSKCTVQTTGEDTHGHLLGIHAFVNAGDRYMIPGSLSAACFWVGLRQEIYSAVISHDVVRMSLNHGIVDRSTEPSDDETWGNRAVVHCADVLNFCFGEAVAGISRWQELENAAMEWKAALPPSFTPIYSRDREEQTPFPEIWYHKSCQGTRQSSPLCCESEQLL